MEKGIYAGTVAEKSEDFAVRMINLSKYLRHTKKSMFYPNSFSAAVPALALMLRKRSVHKVGQIFWQK